MRNSDYTDYRGLHLTLSDIRDDDERVLLSYEGQSCPFPDFTESKHLKDTFVLIVDRKSIDNAYQVRTYGKYKGFTFGVFSVNVGKEGMVFIGSSNKSAYVKLNLIQINNNWYGIDIHESELEKVWEERTPARGLPMPKGVEKIKIIKE